MQILVVLLSIQISGAAHRVADLLFDDDCASDCSGEGDDSDCPPGCPTCHECTHAQALYVPSAFVAPRAPVVLVACSIPPTDHAPLFSFTDSVFRPPRA